MKTGVYINSQNTIGFTTILSDLINCFILLILSLTFFRQSWMRYECVCSAGQYLNYYFSGAVCVSVWVSECLSAKKNFLTPNTPLIHTSFTYRKLNMDEICGLKFYLLCVHTSQKILLKSLHAQRRSILVLNLYF